MLVVALLVVALRLAAAEAAAEGGADALRDYAAHCECRCCTRVHFRTKCAEPAYSVPLPARAACDSRLATLRDASVCGVAMCRQHFAALCAAPAFLQHTCVSHKSWVRAWGAYLFSVGTLLLLAALVRAFMLANEPVVPREVTPFLKRRSSASPAPPALRVLRPHLSPSPRSAAVHRSPPLYGAVPAVSRLPPASLLSAPATARGADS